MADGFPDYDEYKPERQKPMADEITLTREQVETMLGHWSDDKRDCLATGQSTALQDRNIAVCKLALKQLDQPVTPTSPAIDKAMKAFNDRAAKLQPTPDPAMLIVRQMMRALRPFADQALKFDDDVYKTAYEAITSA